jgi:CubicO group peptidase (beta-lactamase class C family)
VLKLVDQGHLLLEDTIAQHWPGFASNGKAAITVRDLLMHRAGIPVLNASISIDACAVSYVGFECA